MSAELGGKAAERCPAAVAGRACAVIAAGGSGSRLGHAGGKQLLEVAGLPLVSWALRAFDQAASIGHIVIVCPRDRCDEMRACALDPLDLATPVSFAWSGPTRQASTRAGVEAVPASCDIVAIHDGARPLVTPDLIDRAVAELVRGGADGLVCGQPSVDTLKEVDGSGFIAGTPDRARFWTVQTPQVFPVGVMLKAFDAAEQEGFAGTDDASLVERLGCRVVLFPSPRDNVKVTVPEDVPLVEALLRARLG